MDFDPIPDLVVEGYQLAPITTLEPGTNPSGDAYLVSPDGDVTDLHWRGESEIASAVMAPATMANSNGVITVEITTKVRCEADLRAVLEGAVSIVLPPRNPENGGG